MIIIRQKEFVSKAQTFLRHAKRNVTKLGDIAKTAYKSGMGKDLNPREVHTAALGARMALRKPQNKVLQKILGPDGRDALRVSSEAWGDMDRAGRGAKFLGQLGYMGK